jgi:hypothetical protein
MFASSQLSGCMFASPMVIESEDEDFILVATHDGVIWGIHPGNGAVEWSIELPTEGEGLLPLLVATPVVVGDRLVVAYQGYDPEVNEDPWDNTPQSRREHIVRVIDLDERELDDDFPTLVLGAELESSEDGKTVVFNPPTQLSRSALKHAETTPGALGAVYVSFGNKGDVQPWHGWIFEIDLDAWKDSGADDAVTGTLLTTKEPDCGTGSGMYDMRCGGGVWAPSGPLVIGSGDSRELLVPTGNGQLNVEDSNFANGLLKVPAGLDFDPGCDPDLCAEFDPIEPSVDCLASCEHFFAPREDPDDPPLAPHLCEGLTFLECYASLDYDFGANTPALVELDGGPNVFVQPAKDGHVYLLDADHLGTMYDRHKVIEVCGTDEDDCVWDWTGMMVTTPVMTELDGDPLALIPTFMFDARNPSGLVAVRITNEGGTPQLETAWEAPGFDSPEARERFRSHPSRATISTIGGVEYAWVVDVMGFRGKTYSNDKREEDHGWLLGVRTSDGKITGRAPLEGRGQRYIEPLVHQDRLYVGSCTKDNGTSRLEVFSLRPRPK